MSLTTPYLSGGTLGFWCSHAYAYTHKTESPLPDALKGVDAVLWEIFQSLGLDPKIAPVMAMDRSVFSYFKEHFEDKPADAKEYKTLQQEFGGGPEDPLPETMPPSKWIIGRKFGDVQINKSNLDGRSVAGWHELYDLFGKYSPTPIHWLTKAPSKGELQLIYMAVSRASHAPTLVQQLTSIAVWQRINLGD